MDASNWSRARNFGVGHKSGTGVHSCSIWREAGERLHTHQDQRENSILFYHRLMLFLDIIKCPQTDTQVTYRRGGGGRAAGGRGEGRTGDCPGPRKGATTRRNVTQGGGGGADT